MLIFLMAAIALVGDDPGPVDGTVQTPAGHAVAGAAVYLSADDRPRPDGSLRSIAKTESDVAGRFHFDAPPSPAFPSLRSGRVWAYAPGFGLGAAHYRAAGEMKPIVIELTEATRQPVRVVDGQGQPVPGVTVLPFSAWAPYFESKTAARLPEDLAEALGGASGPDGVAEMAQLTAGTPLLTFLVRSKAIGTQRVAVDLGDGSQPPKVVVANGGAVRGRVVREDGKSTEGLEVAIESRGPKGAAWWPVRPPGGPVRVGLGSEFRTPDCLMRGYDYQFRVQADGLNSARSAWLPAPSDGVVVVAKELVLTPTRTVAGRVVDRSGRVIAGAEVIRAGDGPERTATVSDAEGRFRLGGYGEGPALVAARADGYRWGGSLVADGETVVALTRLDEEPERAMPSLPPAPADELIAKSRRLLAPVLDEAMKGQDAAQKCRALRVLAEVAPREARDLAIEAGLATDVPLGRILAPGLARLDLAAALQLVEGQPDPGTRARMLVEVADALPPGPDSRKVPLLVRAAVAAGDSANADDRARNFSAVAERFAELGEMEKALPLYAKAREAAAALGAAAPARGLAAGRLARVDPAAAIPLIREIPDPRQRSVAIMNLAARVAAARPHDFDAVLGSFDRDDWNWSEFLACDRMAPVDRAHAERIADGMDTPYHRGLAFLCLAHGLARTEPEAAERAFHRALAEIEADPDAVRAVALDPLTMTRTVEEIDPALVPEFLWFAASRRRPLAVPR